MNKHHHYKTTIKWTGNLGPGTYTYKSYERSHTISVAGKQPIQGSSDAAFRGDKSKLNPEELLVSSLSACHMLWYLHLCAEAGVVVTDYSDDATGAMQETSDGGGFFTEVTLNPVVTVANQSMVGKATELHQTANALCFIANSVKFPVKHNLTVKIG